MRITEVPTLGEVAEKKLEKAGIIRVEQLLSRSIADTAERTGMDNDSVYKIIEKCREKLEKDGLISKKLLKASELSDANTPIIKTGTGCMDKLLNGGLHTGAVTEVYGEFGSGKTQFCNVMAVRVQLPKDKGGLGGKCIWVDTEKTFSKDRIRTIAEANGLDPEEALDNIIVARAYNAVDMQVILEEIERTILADKDIKLIIIDSATGLFRDEFLGRGNLSERQRYLNKFLGLSWRMAKNTDRAVIWTNQVMVNPNTFYGDPILPIGGTGLSHKSTYRVYFKKSGRKRIGVMVDSSEIGQIEVMFGLHESGIIEPEEVERLEKERKKAKRKEKDL
ncbi:MAG: DNA repair and recombination protein RadA [Nitrosopumilaceae archaeon]|nr:DNA repair and recombination protein RadA [Nitrosopumilaceae archaeon]NIU85987.1 DNA repair and recombination protein RadA [Nitrosopumilaceae archaeon]NIX60206.1 DNA repair and recombination protein RadA [Nitrosopumilaceae archaeon]